MPPHALYTVSVPWHVWCLVLRSVYTWAMCTSSLGVARLRCILMCYVYIDVHLHQDTPRYIRIHQDTSRNGLRCLVWYLMREVIREVISDHQRGNQCSSEVIRAHQSSSMVISGHQWASVVIRAHQSSSDVFRAHQWSSKVIRGNQIYSELISGHQVMYPSPFTSLDHRVHPQSRGSNGGSNVSNREI